MNHLPAGATDAQCERDPEPRDEHGMSQEDRDRESDAEQARKDVVPEQRDTKEEFEILARAEQRAMNRFPKGRWL